MSCLTVRDSDGAVLVYDITDEDSFHKVNLFIHLSTYLILAISLYQSNKMYLCLCDSVCLSEMLPVQKVWTDPV